MLALEQEESIKHRLISKEAYLKRVAKSYIFFAREIENPESSIEKCESLLLSVVRECGQYEFFSLNKAQVLAEVSETQIQEYEKNYSQREKEIESVKAEIDRLKEVLQVERRIRKEKEEYDALAAAINNLPTRDETEREIKQLNEELMVLSADSSHITNLYSTRIKQFQVVLSSVQQLQSDLEQDKKGEQEKNSTREKKKEPAISEAIPEQDKTEDKAEEVVIEIVPSEEMQEDLEDMDSRHGEKRIKDLTPEEFNQIEDIEMRRGKREDEGITEETAFLEESLMKDSVLERLKDEGEEESSKDEQEELKEIPAEELFSKDDFLEEIITDEPEETITDDKEEVQKERKKESSPEEANESEMVDIED